MSYGDPVWWRSPAEPLPISYGTTRIEGAAIRFATPRIFDPPDNPHGKPVGYQCAAPRCRTRRAAYPPGLPRGWKRVNGKTYCPECC